MTRIIRRTSPPVSNLPGVRVPDEVAEANIQKLLKAKPILEQLDAETSNKVDYPAVIARYKEKVTNRSSAIRAMCVECSGGMLSEVRECRVIACALYPYRLGQDPNNKKTRDRLAREGQGNTDDEA